MSNRRLSRLESLLTTDCDQIWITNSVLNYLLGLIVLLIKIAVMLGGGCCWWPATWCGWSASCWPGSRSASDPNRAGIFGLLQPIADAIKLLTKEDIVPTAADGVIFRLAPAVVAVTAMMMFAVVPLGTGHPASSAAPFPW